jgi:two-component system phosphate regulon sensor histidine kinase PhoR
MRKTIPKIGFILISLIVFPTLFFSVYEVKKLNNNEQVIDSIYSSQLSSIVFSLNQYSDDVVNSWANSIDNPQSPPLKNDSLVMNLIQRNLALKAVFFASDTSIGKYYTDSVFSLESNIENGFILHTLKENKEEIQRLLKYFDAGYRQIYPVETDLERTTLLLFAMVSPENGNNICGFFIDSETFIKENLGPKFQYMAQGKFFISAFNKETSEAVYTNDLFDEYEHKIRIKEALWLFKSYEIGIQLNGDPIEDLVNERQKNNIILVVLMNIVLLLGAWFVYRNVRNEVKLAQIKSDFVSNVSHEIKTPLALINMYSETLEMGRITSEEKKIEYYKTINKEARRLSRMVNKILNFSKIESGKREYVFIPTDINEIVERVISTYQHHFKNSNFKCNYNLAENLPLINADEEAITDAINNLIDNAIKYSADTKLIEINTGVEAGKVYVKVKDSGIGIKEKDQALIFDKFYRVTHGNLALHAKGSGIGLNIVKHIVDSHQGEIRVESSYGKGSTFTLFFKAHLNSSYGKV